jgi:hypothetical protein
MLPAGLHDTGLLVPVHHVDDWTAAVGPTDFDKLTLACGPDNRRVETGRWNAKTR